jgi:hypothetical protein
MVLQSSVDPCAICATIGLILCREWKTSNQVFARRGSPADSAMLSPLRLDDVSTILSSATFSSFGLGDAFTSPGFPHLLLPRMVWKIFFGTYSHLWIQTCLILLFLHPSLTMLSVMIEPSQRFRTFSGIP